MIRRMRPSRSYLAGSAGEGSEAAQLSHRRYQKRRLHKETGGVGSGGGTAAAVSRRRPNNGLPSQRSLPRDQSSSPPTYSGRTDTDGDETVRSGGGGEPDSSSGSHDFVEEDVS